MRPERAAEAAGDLMARSSYKRWIIALVVVLVVAALIRFFAGSLLDMIAEMHGRGGGRH